MEPEITVGHTTGRPTKPPVLDLKGVDIHIPHGSYLRFGEPPLTPVQRGKVLLAWWVGMFMGMIAAFVLVRLL